jgi:hypothetical protein
VCLKDQDKAKEALDLQERVAEKARYWYDIRDPVFNDMQRNLEWMQR